MDVKGNENKLLIEFNELKNKKLNEINKSFILKSPC
jgi:hypothetical protein